VTPVALPRCGIPRLRSRPCSPLCEIHPPDVPARALRRPDDSYEPRRTAAYALSSLRRPSCVPLALLLARPALVRSEILTRSCLARTPKSATIAGANGPRLSKNTQPTKPPVRGCLANGKLLSTYLDDPRDTIIVFRHEPRETPIHPHDRIGDLLD